MEKETSHERVWAERELMMYIDIDKITVYKGNEE